MMDFYNGHSSSSSYKTTNGNRSRTHNPSVYTYGSAVDSPSYYDDERYNGHQTQTQKLKQHQRSAEASAQMVYEVYGNVIGILEEHETRELKNAKLSKGMKRSDIYIPNQSHKSDRDVKSILEAQLLLFETQLKSCRTDIRDTVVKNLKELTLQWNAERQTHKLPDDQLTDVYLGRLYEILARGSTRHSDDFREKPKNIKGVTREDMEVVIGAQHRISHLDTEFENPAQRAKTPTVRPGDLYKGAERLLSVRSDLEPYIPRNEHMDMT